MDECELTILMPCLNEAETLAACIQKAKKFLSRENINGEVLIADNNSCDGSQAIALHEGANVINVTMPGYGVALKAGIRAAKGKYIIMGDADDSYNFLLLESFITKLRQGYDLVMGNRFQGGIRRGAMPFLNRYLGNPVLSLLGRIFFKSHIGDFHCGLRGFKRECLLALDLKGNGMEFASEMIVKATLHRLRITEVPTQLFPDGRSRRPHLRRWRDGWRHLRLLLLLSPRWLFLYPGIALLLIGILLLLILTRGTVAIGMVSLDIHTMLFASLFSIIGIQAICFALFANQIALFHLKLPQQYRINVLQFFTLERGLIFGLLLMLMGGGGAIYTFCFWLKQNFGPLIPSHVMRILIPSITVIIVGLQLLFSSFFLSLIQLHFADRQH